MNETWNIQPEAFPMELVTEYPETSFETEEFEEEHEEEFEDESEEQLEEEDEAEFEEEFEEEQEDELEEEFEEEQEEEMRGGSSFRAGGGGPGSRFGAPRSRLSGAGGRLGGPRNQFGVPRGRFGGPRNRLVGAGGRFGGPRNRFGGAGGPFGGPRNRFGGAGGPFGGPRSRFGGAGGSLGGPRNRLGGVGGRFGGPRNRFGGERGPFGGLRNRLGGPGGRFGGPGNRLGGPRIPRNRFGAPINSLRAGRLPGALRPFRQRGLIGQSSGGPRSSRFPRGRFLRGRRFLFDGLSGPVPSTGIADAGERGRWVQDCLNRVMQLNLPVTGVMDAATRSAVRSFQQRENLRATGIVGPDTEEALRRACSGADASPQDSDTAASAAAPESADASAAAPPADAAAPAEATEQEWNEEWSEESEEESLGDLANRIAGGVTSAASKVLGAIGGAGGSRIIDLTAQADKSLRKGTRDAKKVYALVLHQMACCFKPKDPLKRFLTLNSHFAILADGRILQLHPITSLLWASNGFNARSVAVEFAGNFPDTQGKWWKGETFGKNRPTPEQLEAGRYLVRYLIKTIGLTHVLAHRQSSGSRTNDPGPEVWSNVGQWAVENLGMKDGGPSFKVTTGAAIPDAWRTWGRSGVTHEMENYEEETEHQSGCGCKKYHGSRRGGRWVRDGKQITLLNAKA